MKKGFKKNKQQIEENLNNAKLPPTNEKQQTEDGRIPASPLLFRPIVLF